ncbi:MAG: Unknown protein [uncultured Sulfurovum sp.]|uniref:RiboL-PSP-HEPN domain-containing protein n=1 Tax=uncultured Sulfurovum sp. TaxID=269237 RepID=A0A6S6SAW2_9BACT|nr:MAG: Unknown protein [uncultured Sulfurovum sp.]
MPQELIDNFYTVLDTIIEWRFQELANIDLELDSLSTENNIAHKSFLLRGTTALIYAHWEGAVKNIFLEFNNFLNKLLEIEAIKLSKNTVFILELLLYKYRDNISMGRIICDVHTLNKLLKNETIELEVYKINILDNIHRYKNTKNSDKLETIENFLEKETKNNKIEKGVVNTNSNLGFEELKNILNKFDIIMTDDIQIQKYRMKQLLNNRNDIAHGDNKFFHKYNNIEKINKDIVEIRKTLESIKDLINTIRIKTKEKAKNLDFY